MRRGTIAIIWAAVLLLARTTDAGVTYHYSPDLANEANPLVKYVDQGWPALLVVNGVLSALVLACTVYWWRRPIRYVLPANVSGVWTFASYALYGRVYSPGRFVLAMFTRLTGNWRHIAQLFGFIFPPVVSIGSLAGALTWARRDFSSLSWYWRACEVLGYPWYVLVPAMPFAVVLTVLFYRSEYRRCLREQTSQVACAC